MHLFSVTAAACLLLLFVAASAAKQGYVSNDRIGYYDCPPSDTFVLPNGSTVLKSTILGANYASNYQCSIPRGDRPFNSVGQVSYFLDGKKRPVGTRHLYNALDDIVARGGEPYVDYNIVYIFQSGGWMHLADDNYYADTNTTKPMTKTNVWARSPLLDQSFCNGPCGLGDVATLSVVDYNKAVCGTPGVHCKLCANTLKAIYNPSKFQDIDHLFLKDAFVDAGVTSAPFYAMQGYGTVVYPH